VGNKTLFSKLLLPLAIILAPFTRYLFEVVELNIANWILIASILSIVLDKYLQHKLKLSKTQLIGLSLMSMLILLQSISILVKSGVPRQLVAPIVYILFFVAVFLYIDSNSDIVRLFQTGFFLGIVMSIATISHILLFPDGLPFGDAYLGRRSVAGFIFPFQRSLGFDITYGTFGMYLMISTPYYIYKNINYRSPFELLGILLILTAVILTQSRSTWVAAAAAVLIVLSFYVLEANKNLIKYFIPVSILTLAAVGPVVVNVLISIRPDTFYSRISQYNDGVDIVLSYPLLGVGLGNIEKFREGSELIHNPFINLAAEAGLPSLFIIIALWLITVSCLLRMVINTGANNGFAIGLLASLVAILIELTFHPGFKKTPWIVMAIALSLHTVVSSQTGPVFRNG
jgi:hypothetical protein